MTLPPLGLDLAKLKFNACLVRDGGKLRHKVFPNTAEGFAQLSEWMAKQGAERVHACMEATGTYGDALAAHLHEAGHAVSRVNPAAVKAYAQSHLSRTKNDRVDAALIAGYCAERRLPRGSRPRASRARSTTRRRRSWRARRCSPSSRSARRSRRRPPPRRTCRSRRRSRSFRRP